MDMTQAHRLGAFIRLQKRFGRSTSNKLVRKGVISVREIGGIKVVVEAI